jgi:hypothetical protein
MRLPAAAQRLLSRHHADPLAHFMNTEVVEFLYPTVPRHVKWGSQAAAVFEHLAGDFMTDVISVVDELLALGELETVMHADRHLSMDGWAGHGWEQGCLRRAAGVFLHH